MKRVDLDHSCHHTFIYNRYIDFDEEHDYVLDYVKRSCGMGLTAWYFYYRCDDGILHLPVHAQQRRPREVALLFVKR